MSIYVKGASPPTVMLRHDAKGQLVVMQTVAGRVTKRRLKGESLEDFQVRLQEIVNGLQVRSRARDARARDRSPRYCSSCGAALACSRHMSLWLAAIVAE